MDIVAIQRLVVEILRQQYPSIATNQELAVHGHPSLKTLVSFPMCDDLLEYLRGCLPKSGYCYISACTLGPLEMIKLETLQAVPGCFLRRYGYIVIGRDGFGNAICVHTPTGKAYFANYIGWYEDSDEISYQNKVTREWVSLKGFTEDNVKQALHPLGDKFDTFIIDILQDRMADVIERLNGVQQ